MGVEGVELQAKFGEFSLTCETCLLLGGDNGRQRADRVAELRLAGQAGVLLDLETGPQTTYRCVDLAQHRLCKSRKLFFILGVELIQRKI